MSRRRTAKEDREVAERAGSKIMPTLRKLLGRVASPPPRRAGRRKS